MSDAQMGGVDDKSAIKYDKFTQRLRSDPLYKNAKYNLFDKDGNLFEETGLWLNVDGGYFMIPELLVGDPEIFEIFMNFWTAFMKSDRKHVECAFGILKSRFRILKLPIRMQKFELINKVFITCCILHNMCLEVDGGDDGWDLGVDGTDGNFSDEDNHRFYWSDNVFYDLTPTIDYSFVGSLHSSLGSKRQTEKFKEKRDRQAQHWYYMYRERMINWDK